MPSSITLPHFDHITMLEAPAEGVPELIRTPHGLERAINSLGQGAGPTAVDTEFAQGIRYDGRAFLVQLRREGAGTWMIDAEALGDLSALSSALEDAPWVVHSAAQDLLALAKRNMYPQELFDTEMAAKLLGIKKSGLTFVLEKFLGKKLAKEHQLHDWSQRPLPETWLNYAALDVELLLPLRETMIACLEDAGRLQWALAESEFIRRSYSAEGLKAKTEAQGELWRKTSHLSSLKNSRQYAIVRELWRERDKIAQAKDVHPKKILSDRILISLAQQAPRNIPQLFKVPGLSSQRKQARRWFEALQRAYGLKADELPPTRLPATGPPPHSFWANKKADAAVRLHAAKQRINAKADALNILPENLISPETIRRLAWQQPPKTVDFSYIVQELELHHARKWQIDMVTPLLVEALQENIPGS